MHVIEHVAPSLQVTLPLSPTVAVQLAPLQSMLHDAPHSPRHVLPLSQSSEQLDDPQALPENEQASPAAQLQLVPVHSTFLRELPSPSPSLPQARQTSNGKAAARTARATDLMAFEYPLRAIAGS